MGRPTASALEEVVGRPFEIRDFLCSGEARQASSAYKIGLATLQIEYTAAKKMPEWPCSCKVRPASNAKHNGLAILQIEYTQAK